MPANYKRKRRGKKFSDKKSLPEENTSDKSSSDKSSFPKKSTTSKKNGFTIKQCSVTIKQFALQCIKHIASFKIQKNSALMRFLKSFSPVLLGGLFTYAVLGFSGIGGYIATAIAESIAEAAAETVIAPMVSILAVALVALVSFIPVVSPLLGPGLGIAVIAAMASGILLASGLISPFIALPALFAIDVQMGNAFPSSFAMGETEPETLTAGVPGIYFTRLIFLPAAVSAAYFFSFIVFK